MSICIDCHAHFLPDAFVEAMRMRGLAQPDKASGTLEVTDALTGYAKPTTSALRSPSARR